MSVAIKAQIAYASVYGLVALLYVKGLITEEELTALWGICNRHPGLRSIQPLMDPIDEDTIVRELREALGGKAAP